MRTLGIIFAQRGGLAASSSASSQSRRRSQCGPAHSARDFREFGVARLVELQASPRIASVLAFFMRHESVENFPACAQMKIEKILRRHTATC